MPDIQSRTDIQTLVTQFYDKLAQSDKVKHIFFDRLGDGDWIPHLQRIVDFWETVLLGATTYTGQSFAPHASMNLEQTHFDEWLHLFNTTVDELFEGPVATDAKKRAHTMAVLFMSKINYYRDKGTTPLI
jgi:hemoglobin